MKAKYVCSIFASILIGFFHAHSSAQDLGPHFKKIAEGIFVRAVKPADSNAAIILSSEGMVLIDSGHNSPDSIALSQAIKKLRRCRCAT